MVVNVSKHWLVRRYLLVAAACCLLALAGCEEKEGPFGDSDERIRNVTLLALAGARPPLLRFRNESGATEKYSLHPDSACATAPEFAFASMPSGQVTAAVSSSGQYLNINSANCISSSFRFAYISNGIAPITVTCTVGAVTIVCDDPDQKTVNR